MLDTLSPHTRRQRGLGRVHQEFDENIFLSCRTSFRPSFLREINLKLFQVFQRHVGHPHGRCQRGLGGVHRVVDENIFDM